MAQATELLVTGRGVSGSAYLTEGQSSSGDPIFASDRAYVTGLNVLNREGLVSTRPAFAKLSTTPVGAVQGFTFFRPLDSAPYLVAAFGGAIYALKHPYSGSWTSLGISMYSKAKFVYFESAVQSVRREDSGELTLVEPRKVLMVQDGGYSRAAYWDSDGVGTLDASAQAEGYAVLDSDGGVAGVVVTNQGETYLTAPAVHFSLPDGAVAPTATANIIGGKVASVTINTAGSGYLEAPAVWFSAAEGPKLGTPTGGPMKWSGDRLWVARGNKLFASDISDPKSFSENIYVAEGGYFMFPEPITALAELASSDSQPALIVFTGESSYLLQSGVRDRASWKVTPNFQRELFPGVGCVAHRSVVSRYGMLWWMTSTGLTNLNAAAQSKLNSKIVPQDTALREAKKLLKQDLSTVCAGAWENFLLFGVPYADLANTQIWVRDQSVVSSAAEGSAEAWAGVWNGLQPVQFAAGEYQGQHRLFLLRADGTATSRLLEVFPQESISADREAGIVSCLETKTHISFSDKAGGLDRKQFRFAEVHFTNVSEETTVKIYWRGTRGQYKLLGTWTLKPTVGQIVDGVVITEIDAIRGQARVIRTPDVTQDTTLTAESGHSEWIDVGFSLAIQWTGRAAVRTYRIFADPQQESGAGDAAFVESVASLLDVGYYPLELAYTTTL